MEEKLKQYVEQLFEHVPVNRKVLELKEELYANSVDRYRDLAEEGKSEEDAYRIVIRSIGSLDDLLREIEWEETAVSVPPNHKYAQLKAITVCLYLLGLVVFLMGVNFLYDPGLVLMLTMLYYILPIGLNVYLAGMTKKQPNRKVSVVEEFKEWQSGKRERRSVRISVSVIIWSVVLCAYFLTSFLSGAWHITWILFLAAVCMEAIASITFSLKK